MYFVWILAFGAIRTSAAEAHHDDCTLSLIFDCSLRGQKDLEAAIWGSTFPDNVHIVTIENCRNLVLDIGSARGGGRKNLTGVIVKNVDYCKIIGGPGKEQGKDAAERGVGLASFLPRISTFSNVGALTIRARLYHRERKFAGGILEFRNVTMGDLGKSFVRPVAASLAKFSMDQVNVTSASENAVVFWGSPDSVLEVKNSIFPFVPENFITCNVTNATITMNHLGNLSRKSLTLNARNLDFSGNSIGVMENFALDISAAVARVQNNSFRWSNKNSFMGLIVGGKTFSPQFPVDDDAVEDEEWETNILTTPASGSLPTKDTSNEKPKIPFTSSNKILVLWFLSVLTMTLLFPVAYFAKILLCSAIDDIFPADVKYRRL